MSELGFGPRPTRVVRAVAQFVLAGVVAMVALSVVLEVCDDGRGFVVAETMARPSDGHLGLRLLSELAVDAGGMLRVDSGPGAGTVLRLEVAST